MTPKNYKLDDVVFKVTKGVRLLQTERGIVELGENALAISIILNEKPRGYVFHGQGKLLIDAIVETKEGAIGKPIDRELNEPFLMLGDTDTVQQYFADVDEHGFGKMGYENQQGFMAKAEDLLKHFFKERVQDNEISDAEHGLIFAFSNENGDLDMLVVKECKLVYNTKSTIFVSDKNKTVLKSPNEVIVSNDGKSVIIKKGNSLILEK